MRSYRLPDGEGDVGELEWVTPQPAHSGGKAVWITEQDVDILEEVGLSLCRLGAPGTGQRLLNIVSAWRLVV